MPIKERSINMTMEKYNYVKKKSNHNVLINELSVVQFIYF